MPNPVRCAECGTPVAEVQGETLVIRSKHHGDQHVTVITLDELRRLLEREAIVGQRFDVAGH